MNKPSTNAATLVVFDAVGTLIHCVADVDEVYFEYGRRFGSQKTLAEVSERFSIGRKQFFGGDSAIQSPSNNAVEKELWGKLVRFVFDDVTETETIFANLWDYFARVNHWSTYADTQNCIQSLRTLGYQVAIGSNFDSRLCAIIERLIPSVPPDNVHFSSGIGFRKPDRRFYRAIAKNHSNCLQFVMIGDDRKNDFEAPKDTGWHALLLDRHSRYLDEIDRIVSLVEVPRRLND